MGWVTGDDDTSASSNGQEVGSGAAATLAALPADANNTTLTAEGFVNSVGVGVHLAYLDTSYGQVDAVKLVEELGVQHVRDGLGSADSVPIESMKRLSTDGISINWVSQPENSSFTIADQLKVIKDNNLNVTSVEGVNERDNAGMSDWAAKVRDHQNQLYDAVKSTLGSDVAVVAPSLVHDESRAELGQVKSDIANSHPYTGGEMQTAALSEHQVQMAQQVTSDVDTSTPQPARTPVLLSSAVHDGGAMWATELGFHTATSSTPGNGVQPYVSEEAQAVLQLQQLLTTYAAGVDRSFIYELMDEGTNKAEAEDNFGMVHADGSPKPVYTALKNLLTTIGSGGPTGPKGAAPVQVDTSRGSSTTTTLTLPRADGSTVVAVWEASPVWDTSTQQPVDVPQQKVTLTLGQSADAQVFVPGQSAKALTSAKDITTVDVTSQAAPTIIVLAPTGETSAQNTSASTSSTPTSTPTSPPTTAAASSTRESATDSGTKGSTSPAPTTSAGSAGTKQSVRIETLGDSIIDNDLGGARPALQKKFADVGITVDWVGSSNASGPASLTDRATDAHWGKSIADMLPQTAQWVQAAHPDIIMVSAGGNDMMHNQGDGIAERWSEYLNTICQAAPGVPIVAATNHQLNTQTKAAENTLITQKLNPIIEASNGTTVSGACPVTVVNMDGVISDDELLDDLHPNETGYANMAEQWFPALRTAVNETSSEAAKISARSAEQGSSMQRTETSGS